MRRCLVSELLERIANLHGEWEAEVGVRHVQDDGLVAVPEQRESNDLKVDVSHHWLKNCNSVKIRTLIFVHIPSKHWTLAALAVDS